MSVGAKKLTLWLERVIPYLYYATYCYVLPRNKGTQKETVLIWGISVKQYPLNIHNIVSVPCFLLCVCVPYFLPNLHVEVMTISLRFLLQLPTLSLH